MSKSEFASGLVLGGAWHPSSCSALHTVAVIIPYRDRAANLAFLLRILHPFLQKQNLDYQIFVVEQSGNKDKLFNKGKLYNVAFSVVQDMRPDINCIIFHDVDLIPEDHRLLYTCNNETPVHLGAFVDTLGYTPMYNAMVGGVLALTKQQYLAVNGFSNMYWGWGGEDDDMGYRILASGFQISRPSRKNLSYTMLSHKSRKKDPETHLNYNEVSQLIKTVNSRFRSDGLNSLVLVGFHVEVMALKSLYTHFLVDVMNMSINFKTLPKHVASKSLGVVSNVSES